MLISKSAALRWPARIGVVAVVAAAGLVALPGVGSAAAIVTPATPATGAAGNWIQLNSPTPFTFRDAGSVLKVNNNGTSINPWAVQFSATACATTAAAIPTGTHTIPDVVTTSASTAVTSASNGFLDGAASATTDVGKVITGTGIPASTTLSAVGSTGAATLSGNASASGTTAVAIGAAAGPYWAQQAIAVSGTKLSVKAPAYLPPLANSASYNVCVYDVGVGAANQVLATATFKSFAAPTIISVSSIAGPGMGGNSITVTGTGLSTTAKAYIGGVPLNNQVVNTTAQTVTGTAPAGQGIANITLVSDGGTVGYPTAYTYQDGLLVTPNMIPQGGSTILDIFGTGFQGITMNFADFAPTSLGTVVTTAATDLLTVNAAEDLAPGDRVRLGTVATTTGITSGATYWVKTAPSTTTLTLSATPTGSTLDLVTDGTITAIYDVDNQVEKHLGATTLTTGTDLVTTATHGLAVGDPVVFGTVTTSTSIVAGTTYYVRTVPSTTTFTIAATPGGITHAINATGSSTDTIRGADANSHVVLALGAYNPAAAPGTPGSPAAECTGVTVFSDNELICNLMNANLADGSYQVAVLDDIKGGIARATIATSFSAFTSAVY